MTAETGLLGLMVRGVGRMAFGTSSALDRIGCELITCVPPALLTRGRDRRRLERNQELAGRHAGQRCFILGNGPSLREEELSLLSGEVLITVNQGHLFARRHNLIPSYHACVDSIYLTSAYDDLLRDWATFQEETGTSLLLSLQIAKRFEELGLDVRHYAVKQFLKSTYFDRSNRMIPFDLHFVQPGYLSVIHFAIVAAIYMGFTKICLLGCDMDFFVNPDAVFAHSYEDEGESEAAGTAAQLFGWDQVELMEWCLDEYRAFRQLGRLAAANGSRVINAGRKGALNVFPRESLRSICERRTKDIA